MASAATTRRSVFIETVLCVIGIRHSGLARSQSRSEHYLTLSHRRLTKGRGRYGTLGGRCKINARSQTTLQNIPAASGNRWSRSPPESRAKLECVSALHPIADMPARQLSVRYGPIVDIVDWANHHSTASV
jgi:hypothetical protein